MSNLERAKNLLSGNKTCALVCGKTELTSESMGISPMMNFLAEKMDLKGFSVADRIVGKAAAYLFLYAGIVEVFAKVISQPALQLLKENGVRVEYETLTENIINRAGTGLCPMEQAVLSVTTPDEAYEKLKIKFAEISKK